jgi:ABC-2 type transport system ATP-binding protein
MVDVALAGRGLVRLFGDGAGVRGMDITVAAGQIHALVGLNGAGKSTLMRILLGMLKPTSGTVTIEGRGLETADWASVGHLVETPLAYGELTVRQNLVLGARLHGVPSSRVALMVDSAMAELRLDPYASRRSRTLSLGNRQRLGLASALQHDPRIIVLDEPSNGLDPAGVILLREALLSRVGKGAAVLVSSHHLDEVARLADRISVVNQGRIIGELDPRGLDIERSFFDLVLADDTEGPCAQP